jgi:hypothetical protein
VAFVPCPGAPPPPPATTSISTSVTPTGTLNVAAPGDVNDTTVSEGRCAEVPDGKTTPDVSEIVVFLKIAMFIP